MSGGSSKGGSWRKGARSSSAGTRHWKRRSQKPVIDGVVARRLKLAFFAAASLVLIAAFVAYLLYLPKAVTLLVVEVSGMPDPLPPNAMAREDVQRMADVWADAANLRVVQMPGGKGDKNELRSAFQSALDDVHLSGPGFFEKTLIIYITAHGVVDEKGQPCLLTRQSDPWDSSTWLPLKSLLEDLKANPRLNRRTVRRVVLLETGKVPESWHLGILQNSFADRLEQLVLNLKDPSLFVINATRGDERGWFAPEIGGTPFGYFVLDALNGGGSEGRRVMLSDLRQHLEHGVDAYARVHRASRQRPKLLTTADDVDFCVNYAPRAQLPELRSDANVYARLQQIQLLWESYDELAGRHAYGEDPRLWSRLQHLLVRLEVLPVAGSAYDESFRSAVGEAQASIETLRHLAGDAGIPAPSLAVHRRTPGYDAQAEESARAMVKEWLKLRAEGKPEPPPQIGHAVAAGVVWDQLCNSSGDQNEYDQLLELLKANDSDTRPEYTELQFAKLLRRDADWPNVSTYIPQALRMHSRREQVAALPDPRVHYWLRPLLAEVDRWDRRAFDHLLIGNKQDLEIAANCWQQLSGSQAPSLETAENATQQIVHAWRIRDRAFADLVHYAHWLTIHPHLENRAQLLKIATGAIGETHSLSRDLDAPSHRKWERERLQELSDQTKSVESALDQLQDAWNDTCNTLHTVEDEPDPAVLTKIGAVLRTPLLPNDVQVRNRLRERYWKSCWRLASTGGHPIQLSRLADRVAEQPAAEQAPANPSSSGPSALELVTTIPRHPALAPWDDKDLSEVAGELGPAGPLSVSAEASPQAARLARLARLEELGGFLRERLNECHQDAMELLQAPEASLDPNGPSSVPDDRAHGQLKAPADVRRGLSRAERLVRATAPLAGSQKWSDDAPNPLQRLRSLDRYFYALWHAERVLLDLWADDESQVAPHFVTLAKLLVGSAKRIYPEAHAYDEQKSDRIRQMSNRIDQLQEALGNWQIDFEPLQFFEDQEYVDHEFNFHYLDVPSQIDEQALRNAQAAVLVPSQEDRLGVPVRGAEGTSEIEKRQLRLTKEDTEVSEVVRLFRGHQYERSLDVQIGSGITVLYKRPEPESTKILVHGDLRDARLTLFVLDCSASMQEPATNDKKVRRFHVATKALRDVVNDLDPTNNSVALMLYGHRSKAVMTRDGKHLQEGGEYVFEYPPATDAELVISMQPLDRTAYGGVSAEFKRFLDRVRPTGQTPLYYAIIQALEEVNGIETFRGAIKQIIVITDGANNLGMRHPSDADRRTEEDVRIALHKCPGVHVHLIGFQSEELPRELSDLANRQLPNHARNFSLAVIDEADALQSEIEKLLPRREFEVMHGQERWGRKRFGQTWEEPSKRFDKPLELEVRVPGASPPVATQMISEGGESFQLRLVRNTGGARLVHSRYDENLQNEMPYNQPNAGASDGSGYFVGVHTPKFESDESGAFLVSVQNSDPTRFSRRPRYVYAEIRPADVSDAPIFYAYDREFVPLRPVPLLQFRVSGWPVWAKQQAEMRLWFSMDPSPPGATVVPLNRDAPTVTNVSGVQFAIEHSPSTSLSGSQRIVVHEKHSSESTMNPVWLAMEPQADQVRHTFNADARWVRHVYIYASQPATPRLMIVPSEQLKQSWIAAPPLVVELPNR